MNEHTKHTCKECGEQGSGKFCSNCGQLYAIKKITLGGILHEVFHFFTHLEKGYPYTLKELVIHPGTMQKDYIDGHRVRHQKPFSMFFLCVTISALSYYWINYTLVKYYHTDAHELTYFNKYMVMLQIGMVPLLSIITFIFFFKSGYNYAQILVQMLYCFSVIFLLAAVIQLLKFIWPHLQTRYIELPLITFYIIVTNMYFFSENKWITLVKSILCAFACFFIATFVQDRITDFLSVK